MRIAFVYDVPYPWHKGGVEYILSVEARELAKKYDVSFFTLRWPGMGREFEYGKVKYKTFGRMDIDTAYRHGRRSVREVISFSALMINIFRYDFDVIISDEFPVLHLLLLRAYCRLKGAKLILKVEEVWDRRYWWKYLGVPVGEAAYLYSSAFVKPEGADYVVVSSTTAKKLEGMGVSKSRIRVFAPVLNSKEIEKMKKAAVRKTKRIFFSGRFIKEKRIDKWLEAVKKVVEKDRSVRAVLVGNGPEKRRILERIKNLGLEGHVTVKPFFKNKLALYKEIASSGVLLHMSEREGLSIIAIESVALGTPVVIPNYSPIPKEVKEMCFVEREEKIPDLLLKMLNSKGKHAKNETNLKMFSDSNVVNFYEQLIPKQ